MTFPTHLLAGLIIGKVTGDYKAAIAASVLIDFDHCISYFRHGILFKPKKLLHAICSEEDPWHDQRNFLHSIFSFTVISGLLLMIDANWGLTFSIAYFTHLLFDAFDGSEFYPFFPLKKVVIRGPIKYYSKGEIIFDIFLALIFLLLFVI